VIAVVWHDLECGAYLEDLPVWQRLAAQHGNPILDVGAGTGRVTLDLARRLLESVIVIPDAAAVACDRGAPDQAAALELIGVAKPLKWSAEAVSAVTGPPASICF